jgi:hypothetical protein
MTFRCTKPLHFLEVNVGKGFAKWAWKWFPAGYHQFSCVIRRDGTIRCDGQDRAGSFLRSPGKPTREPGPEGVCNAVRRNDECYENCMEKEWNKKRPTYGIPLGTDCQEYDDGVHATCRQECGK